MKRLPAFLSVGYLALVGLSLIPVFVDEDPLSGVLAVLLTSPWVQLLGKLLPGAGGGWTGLVLIMIAALINAVLIFFVTNWIVGKVRR